MSIKISPSLMCMDMLNVSSQIAILNPKVDYLHIDIIDWHYVKNLCLSPSFMDQLKKITDVPMDAHLMVEGVDVDLADYCIETGAGMVTLPADQIGKNAFRLINSIKDQGKLVGIYVNPALPLDTIGMYIHLADKITIMTVDPGYAGQKFVSESLGKIEYARELKEKHGYKYEIEIDGSCNVKTYADLYQAGAEVFVVGSSGLFSLDSDLNVAWERMAQDIYNTTGQGVRK